MGKVPPSFRTAISNSLVKKIPLEPQTAIPRQFPGKTPEKKPSQHSKTAQASRRTESLFKSPDLSSAKKVLSSIVASTKAPLDVRFHNALLQSYASVSTLNDSISFLHHMLKTQPSFSPDRSTYHILLSQSCKAPDSSLSPVHQTLNLMVTNGFQPNQVTVDVAIRSLCQAGRIDHALQLGRLMAKGMELYGAMKSAGMKLETASYATLVRALCKEGRVAEAYEVFDYAVESKSVTDVAAYSTLEVSLKWLKKAREQGLAV
ncbi:hypothetical protein COLO4_22522 [Corchorus olitorius]|uniref:Pentacotripeptide-repeat region of PRORP domain-containing protein n=1 Tax=Corchorus olitorius TaxID=93759 RepID=A0A1R3ILM2_9ROSI|nr:hypothetical protein COLO4_22522 [Corchorus olitorius]